jgi:predicted Zn finger-like uncharacterized protein
MAATITVTCPECDTTIKTSAEVQGKKVRCKSCGEVFVATPAKPAGAAKSAAAKPAAKAAPKPEPKAAEAKPKKPAIDDDEDDGKAYGLTETDLTPRCPHCANELESAKAKICLHCGYNTETREQVGRKKVVDQTGGDVFMWLLPGILCVLGIISLIVWDILYVNYAEEWFDVETWYGGMLCHGSVKMWSCIFTVSVMAGLARFAYKRLIVNNKPPEIEIKAEDEKDED